MHRTQQMKLALPDQSGVTTLSPSPHFVNTYATRLALLREAGVSRTTTAAEFRQTVEHVPVLRRGVTDHPEATLAYLPVVSKMWWRGHTLLSVVHSRLILWSPSCRLLEAQVL